MFIHHFSKETRNQYVVAKGFWSRIRRKNHFDGRNRKVRSCCTWLEALIKNLKYHSNVCRCPEFYGTHLENNNWDQVALYTLASTFNISVFFLKGLYINWKQFLLHLCGHKTKKKQAYSENEFCDILHLTRLKEVTYFKVIRKIFIFHERLKILNLYNIFI